MSFIAALPMYEWPETQADTDMEWQRFREFFRRAGIDAPETIVRRNAEMRQVFGHQLRQVVRFRGGAPRT